MPPRNRDQQNNQPDKERQERIENLKMELNRVTEELKGLGYDETARLKEAFDQGTAKMSETKDKMQEEVKRVADKADAYAHEKPWNVAWSSLILGVLAGLMLARGNSSDRRYR